ncbi:hypothetical protein T05_12778 [Trichinella murrelli]|uniref:Uncharacterized protein n=1 Tax=Trichinella murrelli TaxID=144512 RepID=A0A0V0SSQ4_9BILA|nr:hypothetical protein T05_12778 [Trichinella murrelli]
MEVSCMVDTEMEEYVDELESLAESLSDEDHNNSMVRAPATPVQTIGRRPFT